MDLLVTYPRAWREQHGELVRNLQREADTALGRTAPSLADRVAFLVGGVLQHLRPSRGVAPSLALQVGHPALFDQTNGVVAPGTDDLDDRGRRIDRHHGHGGIDAAGRAPAGLMEPKGWD